MLTGFIFFVKRFQNDVYMFFIVDEISIGCIYEKGFDVVLFDVTIVRFLQSKQVIVWYLLFVFAISFFDILFEFLQRTM